MTNAVYQCMEAASKAIRQDVIRMTYLAGPQGAHIGGSLSMCEIIAALYCGVMHLDPADPLREDRDRLILSKGHGAIAMYGGLKQAGFLQDEDIITYKQDGSYITAHPSYMPQKGMEFASGSLGQGLSLGVGVCLALYKKGNDKSRVFVLHGDGECAEGSIWEAAASASHYGLYNLVSIVDKNHVQYDGFTTDVLDMADLSAKWEGFGWETCVVDGHDSKAVYDALSGKRDRPFCLICDTIKGKGVSFIENDYRWHNARLSAEQYKRAMEEQGVEV